LHCTFSIPAGTIKEERKKPFTLTNAVSFKNGNYKRMRKLVGKTVTKKCSERVKLSRKNGFMVYTGDSEPVGIAHPQPRRS